MVAASGLACNLQLAEAPKALIASKNMVLLREATIPDYTDY